jgi:hypothetical protein
MKRKPGILVLKAGAYKLDNAPPFSEISANVIYKKKANLRGGNLTNLTESKKEEK